MSNDKSDKSIDCRRSNFSSILEIDEESMHHIDFSEPLHMADGSEPPPSIATGIGIEWNEIGFLIYFRGRFDQLRYPPDAGEKSLHSKTQKLWETSDVFEVFIGPNVHHAGVYKEFQAAPDGRWIEIDVHHHLGISNHFWHSSFRCKSIIDKEMNIWTSVFELPWNCFGFNKKTDDEWQINFFRASGKFHGDELLAWSAPGYGENCFHRPEHFGTIHIIK